MRRVAVALAVGGFLLVLGLGVGGGLWWEKGFQPLVQQVRPKRYSHLVAEGVRYRDTQNFGFDRLAFDRCRVEKRRRGAITFGAFNVLVLDGLVVNLSAALADTEESEGLVSKGFADSFLQAQGLGSVRFSGVRINGMTVNRIASNHLERVFSAAQAETGGSKEGLRLRDCLIHTPEGSAVHVQEARVLLKPELTLVYTKGGSERRVRLSGRAAAPPP